MICSSQVRLWIYVVSLTSGQNVKNTWVSGAIYTQKDRAVSLAECWQVWVMSDHWLIRAHLTKLKCLQFVHWQLIVNCHAHCGPFTSQILTVCQPIIRPFCLQTNTMWFTHQTSLIISVNWHLLKHWSCPVLLALKRDTPCQLLKPQYVYYLEIISGEDCVFTSGVVWSGFTPNLMLIWRNRDNYFW